VHDVRVLKLIRRFLEAGMMQDGVVTARTEGTPQGGPLSPLLSNILLTDLDRELEDGGIAFCRYADDCNVYVRSRRAGERVMAAMRRFLTNELSLRVNEAKSAVDRPSRRKFLGYSFHGRRKLRIATKTIERMKQRVRELTRRDWSISLEERLRRLSRYLTGWMSYFCLTEAPSVLRDLDQWIRRRVRLCVWVTWKRVRTRIRKLRSFGVPERNVFLTANCRRGPWYIAGGSTLSSALSKRWLSEQGLVSLYDRWQQLNPNPRTAVYGSVRTVV
jgi:RNA-directed DNA polymerase